MTQYSWTVIGAGPAGIATVGRLLDHGVAGEQIAWIDPEFGVGDFGAKWGAVPSNTRVRLFLDYLAASPSFRFAQAPSFELNRLDPQQTCLLRVVAEPLRWITQHLRQRVDTFCTIATELALVNRQWTVTTQREVVTSKNVVLAVGAVPKKLSYAGLDEIAIETALDPAKLAQLPLDGATVAVFGSSHSAMIALPNLLNTPVKKVVNFYRSPLKYAVFLDDWIMYDDTGLKGQAAEWARENIDGTCPERLETYSVTHLEFEEILQACDHVVYTIGFERRHLPLTPQWGSLQYDPTNGILAPGLFGIGIAFPEYWIDPLGGGQYRVGLHKFMQRLETGLPLWFRYGT
ncbi:FAD-dependent oxidoreductase [Mycobacterium sherrisii]|uniref:FAD-dependent oxidoreductase n=1 Tax=Mycobacterium sherrisii TaxID=243061 RepID=UPI000A15C258|nr:FAD-dependent oxidoreductase [Mycobacterium sherrisii]MCV7032483.1 FAD-dependent oxidoreductase [Mycobacterium sherrisii]ORW73277.1 pyridine nucleotide-disulfide oxidoreductase [Mycobacterium sherrisii]